MFTETTSAENSQWTTSDKTVMLLIQKGVSVFGIFFTIILATNLFLLEAQQVSMITQYLAWTSVLAAIFFIASLGWAFMTEKKLKQGGDQASDNILSRLIMFFAIVISVQFFIYYIIFEYASENLSWYIQSNNNKEEVQDYIEDVDGKSGWIEFLGFSTVGFLFFTVFSSFAQAGSQITSRLQVYLVGIALAFTCFQEMYNRRVLALTYGDSNNLNLATTIVFILAIVTLVFLLLTFLANAKRLRLAYLLLGTFFIIATAVQISSTGSLFKEYAAESKSMSDPKQANASLAAIDAKYIQDQGCEEKYEYNPDVRCPSNANAQNCFVNAQKCKDGNTVAAVWETYLKPDGYIKAVYACLNSSRCGGIAKKLFTEPLLIQAIYSLQYVFYSFILGCFCYQLSSQNRGQQQINQKVQLGLIGLFVIIIIAGFTFQFVQVESIRVRDGYMQTANIQTSPSKQVLSQIQHNQEFIAQDSSLSGYAAESGCMLINDLLTYKGSKFTNALQKDKTDQQVDSLGDLNALLHSDQIPANNQCQAANGQVVLCDRPGYLVVIEGPAKSGKCEKLPQFVNYVRNDELEKRGIKVIAASTAESLLQAKVQGNPKQLDANAVKALSKNSLYSFVGENSDILNELNRLTICDLGGCDYSKLSFQIRVIQVDLVAYGFEKTSDQKEEQEEENIQLNFKEQEEVGIHHSHEMKKTLLKSHELAKSKPKSKGSSSSSGKNKNKDGELGPVDTSTYNIWGNLEFKIEAYDIISGQTIEGADILAYRVADNKNFSGLCSELNSFMYQPDFNSTTTDKGQSSLNVIFGPDIGANNESVKEPNYITYYVYARANNYHGNCRQISFGYNTLQKYYSPLKIGLNPYLEALQARAVLEFDEQFVNNLYIWTTFGGYDESQNQFDCMIGPYFESCNQVQYNKPERAKDTSSITFDKIGQYDYLIYFNRQINNIEQDEIDGRITNYAQAITSAASNSKSINPIIKYYTGEAIFPEWATNPSLLSESDMKKLDTISRDKDTGIQTAHTNFSFLQFCLLVKDTHSLKPHPFNSNNYLWSQYKGFGIYTEAAASELYPDSQDNNDKNKGICYQLADGEDNQDASSSSTSKSSKSKKGKGSK